jgi:hypothetical protein
MPVSSIDSGFYPDYPHPRLSILSFVHFAAIALPLRLRPFKERKLRHFSSLATPEPVLPKNPTRKQREQYRQKTVVDYCTAVIQKRIHDIPKALEMRALIRNRILRLYKLFAPNIKARTILQNNILVEYDLRYGPSESDLRREFVGTSSVLHREQMDKLNLVIVKE